MNRKDTALMRKLGVCEDAREWCKNVPDLETAWNTCKQSDWMLWVLNRIDYKADKTLRLYACACVRSTPLGDGRTVWDLLTDTRSQVAVEVAERYAMNQTTNKELWAAYDAAYDAASAAAYDAASAAALAAARDTASAAALAAARDTARAAAWAAAWAAARGAAWAAARDAARGAALGWQANKLREFVSWTDVAQAIAAVRGEVE